MRNPTNIIILLLLFCSAKLFAQDFGEPDPMPVRLKAQILSIEDNAPVPYASVMNFRTRLAITTDGEGRFVMDMLNIDSLQVISLGFSAETLKVPRTYQEQNVQTFFLKPVRYAISEVKVKGQQPKVNMDGIPVGKKNDLDVSLRGDAFNEKPPILAAFFNPFSFLQYYISKSEKEKRDVRQAMVTEEQWQVLSKIYTKELVMELTGLTSERADELMIYINSKGLLSHFSNEYDVHLAIKESYQQFKAEGH